MAERGEWVGEVEGGRGGQAGCQAGVRDVPGTEGKGGARLPVG